MKKDNNRPLYWIFKRTKRFLPFIALVTLLNMVIAVSLVALASFSRNVLDSFDAGVTAKATASAIAIFATLLIEIVANIAISLINVRLSGKLTISMRNYMFSSVVHKKYPKVFDHHSGDLLNRFTSDIDQVVSVSTSIIPNVFSMLTKIIVGLYAILIENYIFAIVVVLIGFVLPLIGRNISKKYKYMHKEVQRTEGQARSFMQESFANVVVIKTFVSEQPILKKLNEYMKENLKIKIKRNAISVAVHMCLYSAFNFGYYAILVWGAFAIGSGAAGMSFGLLTYYLQLVSMLRAPLQSVSGIIPQYYAMVASAERLMELENIESEPNVLSPEKIEELKKNFEKISVNDVDFGYADEEILRGCTFEVPKNQITALTGESGSGKSTIFKLLLGLYEPTAGSITFNGDTVIDASTRPMFSYVPQGNMILSGTIRDNLTLCDDTITEEQIENALKAAVIYDFIKTLPNGLDTPLSERGAGLSEGQIQRISIARALLFGAPILLLDESTSALDEQTETELLSNIKNMTDKTVLFITHRNTSISVCDNIIHVENKKFKKIK